MVRISYMFIVCIMLYIAAFYDVNYKFIWSNGVYTDITPQSWAKVVENVELNYEIMHMYQWKFYLYFKICNTSASIF